MSSGKSPTTQARPATLSSAHLAFPRLPLACTSGGPGEDEAINCQGGRRLASDHDHPGSCQALDELLAARIDCHAGAPTEAEHVREMFCFPSLWGEGVQVPVWGWMLVGRGVAGMYVLVHFMVCPTPCFATMSCGA